MQRKKRRKAPRAKKRKIENPISQVLSEQETNKEEKKEEKKEELDRKDILDGYVSLKKRLTPKKAFLTTFRHMKGLWYVAFVETRNQAVWEACKYFKGNFHPAFLCDKNIYYKGSAKRLHVLDNYAQEGIVPIVDLLRLMEIRMPCSICGHGNYSYEDYETGVCFVSEEFSTLPYAKGILMCYNCFKKYMGES